MKKLTCVYLSLILLPLFNFGQESPIKAPDYKKIKKQISKKKSTHYYPSLMDRFQQGDTTLTMDELRHLYYGYTFDDSYKPYDESPYLDSLTYALGENKQIFNSPNYTDELAKEVVRIGDSILKNNPFDVQTLLYVAKAYRSLEDSTGFNRAFDQFSWILETILSSGDGLSAESAYHVINVQHEYWTLMKLGYSFGGSQKLIGNCDLLDLAPNANNIKALYFDVSTCLKALDEKNRSTLYQEN